MRSKFSREGSSAVMRPELNLPKGGQRDGKGEKLKYRRKEDF